MNILRSLTLLGLLAGIGAFLFINGWLPRSFHASIGDETQAVAQKMLQFLQGNSESEIDPAEAERKISQGNQLVRQSRQLLLHNTEPLTADILQILQTPGQSYRASGQYWQAPQDRSRMLIEMEVDQTHGRLLQVSNGQVIWTVRDLTPSTSLNQQTEEDEPQRMRIDRVDTQRIAEEAAQLLPPATADAPPVWEMHGGLPGLMLSLERHLDFQIIREVTIHGDLCFVLEGIWKTHEANSSGWFELTDSFLKMRPDRIRLFIRQADLFPVRYLFLKQHPERAGFYAPLAMEVTNIQHQPELDPSLFLYRPPEDQVPNDVTHEYLARLQLAGKPHDETKQ